MNVLTNNKTSVWKNSDCDTDTVHGIILIVNRTSMQYNYIVIE